ncbi:MAG: GNAT family N-acetyltransferase [Terriglobia bacterium]
MEVYEPKYEACWDEFVRQSKNGVFIFDRGYVEYHADRFTDHSLLFFQDDQLIGVMPANRVEDTVVSHGGLTFGGIISGQRMKTHRMLEVFAALVNDLRARRAKKLIYKAIPHIYHVLPAEEDLYALFRHNAKLVRRDVSSTVATGQKLPLPKGRKGALRRGVVKGLEVARTHALSSFIAIEEANLQSRYGVRPVHTAAEMQLLADRFPENIKLFTASLQGEVEAGVVIYESRNVAHCQYIGATEKGKSLGALDCIMEVLLNEVYAAKPYFDFGISTVDNGRTLNADLIQNKESYGARATVYDFYELSLGT